METEYENSCLLVCITLGTQGRNCLSQSKTPCFFLLCRLSNPMLSFHSKHQDADILDSSCFGSRGNFVSQMGRIKYLLFFFLIGCGLASTNSDKTPADFAGDRTGASMCICISMYYHLTRWYFREDWECRG